jgi:uncharacterized protein (TIGR02118 family)
MVQLIALYRQPKDANAFDDHYHTVHMPLVEQIPGLEKLDLTSIVGLRWGSQRVTTYWPKCSLTLNKILKPRWLQKRTGQLVNELCWIHRGIDGG